MSDNDNEKNLPPDENDDSTGSLGEMLNRLIGDTSKLKGALIPMNLIPASIRDRICEMCPDNKIEVVADLDMNELDDWNSIIAEIERLKLEQNKLNKALDKVQARKSILCTTLEVKHDLVGERLSIEGGKLIRKLCNNNEGKCGLQA